MRADVNSTLQAAYAAVLLVEGRGRADMLLPKWMVQVSTCYYLDEVDLAYMLSEAGLPAGVLRPAEPDAGRLYDRAKLDGWLALGVWEPGKEPSALVWGLTYRKPCKCAGLCLFLGDRARPHPAVPHRNKYLGAAVVVRRRTVVNWPVLDELPILA